MAQLLIVGVTLSHFTALFLVTKRGKSLHDDILAAWLVVMTMPILLGLVTRNFPDARIPLLPHLIYPLTYGPFVWVYVGVLTGDITRLDRRHLMHFLPFAVASLLRYVTGWPLERPTPMMESFSVEIRIAGTVNLALLAVYSVAVFRRLHLHGSEAPQHFSELSGRVTLIWLRWIAAGVTVAFLLLFLGCVLPWPPLLVVHIAWLTMVIMVLCFFGLRQTQLYSPGDGASGQEIEDAEAAREPAGADPDGAGDAADEGQGTQRPNYSRSGLTEERAEAISRRLEAVMQSERPYLDSGLTIEALARRIAVPRHHLTQVINERYGKNFFLFVNEHRIEAVKAALRSPEQADRTLLEIAYESGFSSKSTFNAAFKQITGTTPSKYRNSAC